MTDPSPPLEEVVPAALAGERVDRVVSFAAGCSRREAGELVDSGAVSVNGRVVTSRSGRLHEGDLVTVEPGALAPAQTLPAPDPAVAVEVVYADDHLVVVDKAAGVVVHPGSGRPDGTLVNGLLARFPEIATVGDPSRPGIVHRLDRGTTGLLVVARTQSAHDSLVGQLAARRASRRYLAVVWGRPVHDRGVVDGPIGRHPRHPQRMAVVVGGRPARTHYEVERRCSEPAEVAVVQCRLETGRTHQIRVHLASIGHPVVGDDVYGGGRATLPFARPALHATDLGFDHPGTGAPVEFHADPPPDLASLLDRLR